MADSLSFVRSSRRSGQEPFHRGGKALGFSLLEFWQWSGSDLLNNTARGVLAEFIVAKAMGIETSSARAPWDTCDLRTEQGLLIEVKSAAYVQSWSQKKLSAIQFGVQKRRGWDAETGVMDEQPCRHAHLYVFALLAHPEKSTVDPLNLAQWQFFVLPTRALDARTRSQHSITLRSLTALAGPPVDYWNLRPAVERAAVNQHGDGG